jgi:hypothetical protein
MPPSHHLFDAAAVLGAVKCSPRDERSVQGARSKLLRPALRGPSGIDDASAQRKRLRSRDGRLISAVDTLVSARDTHACLAGHRWS